LSLLIRTIPTKQMTHRSMRLSFYE